MGILFRLTKLAVYMYRCNMALSRTLKWAILVKILMLIKDMISASWASGLPRSGKSHGNSSLSQGQGKVRKFFNLLSKSGKSKGICGAYRCIFFIVWQMIFELGQNFKLGSHSNIICQIFFCKLYLFCIMFGTRYWQFLWCWRSSLVLTYFQDQYVEASVQGCQRSGKSQENCYFSRSGKSQGIL